jgi:dihydroflavonol-4-reductase
MRAFVTGGTGFIGAAIVRALLAEGHQVRALVRPGSDRRNLAGLEVEPWEGDLLDPASLRQGLTGCDTLFHAAADYRLWTPDPAAMYRVNVDGTRAVLQAALDAGVSRTVHTSSVGTLGNPGDGTPGTEETPVSFSHMVGDYKKSKFLAEREAESFAARGLPLIIVNPSTPVGPRDIKPTPTGKIIVDFLNGRMPAYLDTGLNIVDVDECARGHLLAAKGGEIGRKYILGGENLSLAEIFQLLAVITGRPAPKVRLPYLPILAAAWVNEGISRVTGKEPLIPLAGVRMAAKKMYFDSSRAEGELGLEKKPAAASLERAVDWFRRNGYVSHREHS